MEQVDTDYCSLGVGTRSLQAGKAEARDAMSSSPHLRIRMLRVRKVRWIRGAVGWIAGVWMWAGRLGHRCRWMRILWGSGGGWLVRWGLGPLWGLVVDAWC